MIAQHQPSKIGGSQCSKDILFLCVFTQCAVHLTLIMFESRVLCIPWRYKVVLSSLSTLLRLFVTIICSSFLRDSSHVFGCGSRRQRPLYACYMYVLPHDAQYTQQLLVSVVSGCQLSNSLPTAWFDNKVSGLLILQTVNDWHVSLFHNIVHDYWWLFRTLHVFVLVLGWLKKKKKEDEQ